MLRELDDDGRLGLRDAPDDLLDGLCRHTRGNPRALEAVKAILEGDETLTPRDLLDRTRQVPGDRVVQVLVGEAYELLDSQAQRVMQALSVFPAPVSAVGVDFLLRPADPTTDAAPILTRLVRRQMVRFQDARYYLHPLDREYARARLLAGDAGDSLTAFTLTGLQARAADYYAQIRTPRQSWRTLEDVRPQLAEFGLRCVTGDYDTAANVLQDIDYDYLQPWGHYRTLIELHGRIHGRIADLTLNANHLVTWGTATKAWVSTGGPSTCTPRRWPSIGKPATAKARALSWGTWESATTDWVSTGGPSTCILRRWPSIGKSATAEARVPIWETWATATAAWVSTGGPSTCILRRWPSIGKPAIARARAPGWKTWATATAAWVSTSGPSTCKARRWPSPATSATATLRPTHSSTMGQAWLLSGDARQAAALLGHAISIADATGGIEPAMEARSWLARAHFQLGDAAAALAMTAVERELTYPPEEPATHLLEGLALLELNRPEESRRAFAEALTAADGLLALADRNVAALEVRALALSGLAVVAGDPARAAGAAEAFARARAVTRAPGVVADTRRLLAIITAHDQSGLLASLDPD